MVVVVVLLLFGRGKISELMGDMAQGIKAFKKGMQDDEKTADAPRQAGQTISSPPALPSPTRTSSSALTPNASSRARPPDRAALKLDGGAGSG